MTDSTAATVLMSLSSIAPSPLKLTSATHQHHTQFTHRGPVLEHLQSDSTSERLTSSVSPSSITDVGAHALVDGSVSPSSSGVSSSGSSWSSTSHNAEAGSDLSEEAEALLQLSHPESDEGIVSDQSSSVDSEDATRRIKTESVRIIYKCLWPGCDIECDLCSEIERHVRRHLSRDESDRSLDGEEEFYYNEIEVPMVVKSKHNSNGINNNNTTATPIKGTIKGMIKGAIKTNNVVRGQGNGMATHPVVRPVTHPHLTMHPGAMGVQPMAISRMSTVSGSNVSYVLAGEQKRVQLSFEGSHVALRNLADHMDMARPPHENPEYLVKAQTYRSTLDDPFQPNYSSVQGVHPQLPIPISVASFSFPQPSQQTHVISSGSKSAMIHHHQSNGNGAGKLKRLSPKPTFSNSTIVSSSHKSPNRRPRGDAKKCRKVYGMEHRDNWCTQCKWKKACTRFGEGA